MAKPGRTTEPTKLKELKGNPGRRPLPKHEVIPGPGRPACPRWLSPYAKTEWRYIAPKLDKVGLLAKADRMTLAAYCEAAADFRMATEHMQREMVEVVFQTHNGNYLQNPWVSIKQKSAANMVRYAALFGMSPSDRAGWEAPPELELTLTEQLFNAIGK